MKKQIHLTLIALLLAFAGYGLEPIVGFHNVCAGSVVRLYDTVRGGVWTSSNPAIASVDPATGYVTGISVGSATITYTLGTFVTHSITVSPMPGPISGTTTLCAGSTSLLSNSVTGGKWRTVISYFARIDSLSGLLTGLRGGYTDVYYNTGVNCYVYTRVTINDTTSAIYGPRTMCLGDTVTLRDTSGFLPGVWTSSNPSVATIDGSTGKVVTVSTGVVTISFVTASVCGPMTTLHTMTVTNTTSPGTISGPATVVAGEIIRLFQTVPGTWSSGNTAVATIGSTTGQVTGISAGSAVISYAAPGCGGLAYSTHTVTVLPFTGISGNVLLSHGAIGGLAKIWLIKYNPSSLMLTACDSVSTYFSGTSVYYRFLTPATDSYRVKAMVKDTASTTTYGYVPTYHNSTYYWRDADVFYHTTGIPDINKNIDMNVGTITSGPGFIAGNVTTGANKGTSGTPAVGLQMYVINATTNQLIQQTVTDATGHYSFSNLPVGATYKIFPEALSYLTFAYTSINLTSGAPTMTAASFIQHTISKTITPIFVGVRQIKAATSSLNTFPNPTTGKLNVSWETNNDENASVIVTDITGREVYKTNVTLTEGAGMTQLDLNNLNTGLYMISIKSASISYNNKIQVAH